jgi:succinate dehydrogenase / fumarate reductase cytochrome b subunit
MPSSETSSATGADPRPLSPHLQVYRWQITMAMSIAHRATGIILAGGTLLLVWWLVALAMGPGPYASAQGFIGSPIGILMMLGWTVALFYHLANGIRHLFWDAGYGFDIPTVYRSGYAVLALTVVLSVAAWLIAGAVIWAALRGPA